MIDRTYLLQLDELNSLEARFVVDRENAPYMSYVLPRDTWVELGRPHEVWVTVSVEAPHQLVNAPGPEVTDFLTPGTLLPVTVSPGPWTSHGHSIPGVTVAGHKPDNLKVARCGGVRICQVCRGDARALGWSEP